MYTKCVYCYFSVFVLYFSGIGGYGGCNKDDQEMFWNFMYGHAQTSTAIYDDIKKTCGSSLHYGNETAECDKVLGAARTNLGGFNVYNIYDECYLENDQISDVLKRGFKIRDKNGFVRLINQQLGFNGGQSTKKHDEMVGSGINQYACGGETATNVYLNNAAVKQAINVPDIPWTWQGLI